MNKRDLIKGEQFGRLKVVEKCDSDGYGKVRYLCKCNCGGEKKVRRSYLLSQRVQSCGCLAREKAAINGRKYIHMAAAANRRFCGDVSGEFWCKVKQNALTRGISVNVSHEYVADLFKLQGGKCALTGLELKLSPLSKDRSKNTASLDRIDGKRGYELGNLRWVHKDINLMKNKFSDEYFKELCEQVIEYDKVFN